MIATSDALLNESEWDENECYRERWIIGQRTNDDTLEIRALKQCELSQFDSYYI